MSHGLPSYIKSFIGSETFRMARIHWVRADGNCFFDSVRVILHSIRMFTTVKELRQHVAEPLVQAQDELTRETLINWLQIYQGACREHDAILLQQFAFLKGLEHVHPSLELTREEQQRLYEQMTDEHQPLYWGEQHAMRIIEESTGLRFLIISDQTVNPHQPQVTCSLSWYHSPEYKPKAYAILYLQHEHYMPVSLNTQFVFAWRDLPLDFQRFVRTGYTF